MRNVLHITIYTLFIVFCSSSVYGATHFVDQVGFTFSPRDITINEGDTVVWSWTSGDHTVTNGTGDSDPNAGSLFDYRLRDADPTASYTFDTPGFYDYYCRPHEALDMRGTVDVIPAAPTATPTNTNTPIVFDTPTPTPTHTPTPPFTPTPEMTQVPMDTIPAITLLVLGLTIGVLVYAGTRIR